MKKKRMGKLVVMLYLAALLFMPNQASQIMTYTVSGLLQFLRNLIPVFICVGLMDVWIEKEKLMKLMGEDAEKKGWIITLLLGMLTAVPIYALLPIGGMLLKKGGKITNVLIFLCSSASIRIPLLLFELSSLGAVFMLCRFFMNLVAVFVIAFLVEWALTEKDKEEIYEKNHGGSPA